MDWKHDFVVRLTNRREALSLSKSELARRIGVRHVQIVEYEKGRKTPSVETLIALAKVLECSLDWLCGLTDQSEVSNRTTKERP